MKRRLRMKKKQVRDREVSGHDTETEKLMSATRDETRPDQRISMEDEERGTLEGRT